MDTFRSVVIAEEQFNVEHERAAEKRNDVGVPTALINDMFLMDAEF